MTASAATAAPLTVAEAAELLGRHRTRVYALVRSGDLVAVSGADADEHTLLLDRSSVERWAVTGGSRGGPLTPRNAWAIIGLASGDQALADHCLGLLERREEHSRVRARLAADGLLGLAPRLRRRASVTVLHLPPALFVELERDAGLVRTGISSAGAYGWDDLSRSGQPWALDAYLRPEALQVLVDEVAAAADTTSRAGAVPVLLRTVAGPWPFPSHCQLVPQPLAALDLLDYPEPNVQRVGREVLHSLGTVTPTAVARRSARGRMLTSPRVGKLLGAAATRAPQRRVTSDPGADTPAAAAQIVGVLWASDNRGATVKELRATIGLTRERLEAAYAYLLDHPPLGLAIERHGEELRLAAASEVAPAIERHRESPRPVSLSDAALLVLTIVAYRQPVSRAGIEGVRGTTSDSALATLLQRQLIAVDQHRLFVTTPTFLEYLGLRDLADLPPLPSALGDDSADHVFVVPAGWTP